MSNIESNKLKICTYCKTENKESEIRCTFCEADLTFSRPKTKRFVELSDAYKPYPVLKSYHTFDLLQLLRVVRKSRTDAYNSLRITLKASNEMEVPEELKNASEDEYKRSTAYMNLIEEILIDRIGYKPQRVDDKLLQAWEQKINKVK
jgi:hypothetical protein